MKVKFKEWNCIAEFGYYSNGRCAITLNDSEDGSPIATATTNFFEINMKNNEVFIKDYAENTGMTDALIKAGIIHEEPTRKVSSGYITSNSYALTNKAYNEYIKVRNRG